MRTHAAICAVGLVGLVLTGWATPAAAGAGQPTPGSPEVLVDWRWLARPLVGTRHVVGDPWGRRKLEPCKGGFLVLDVPGPGVMDLLWTSTRVDAHATIEVDGKRVWRGAVRRVPAKQDGPIRFPDRVLFGAGGMVNLGAPIGFARRLRLIADKPAWPHFVSYRTLPKGADVMRPDPDPNGPYMRGLNQAADLWKKASYDVHAKVAPPARQVVRTFELPAAGRTTACQHDGSGEVTGIEFHMNPALTGTLRQVVVEAYYDGARAPSLRLPITDLVGTPHPWPGGRWDRYNGDLVAGLRFPWTVHRPRFYFPQSTLLLNLPMPFADGLRVDLVNRSAHTRFVGHTRVIVAPLSRDDARRAGRLCGTRVIRAVQPGDDPKPLIRVPGPGQLAGLGLFMTGNAYRPPAMEQGVVALKVDGGKPITGHGLLPLWLQGIYGGPAGNCVFWNHPRLETGYVGVMRHFLTDPIPFGREAVLGYTPGPKPEGGPKQATVVALWYRFGKAPYQAPALPDQAERLPHSVFRARPEQLGPGKDRRKGLARLVWEAEAEDLLPMIRTHAAEVRVVEDVEHNFHPSAGKYLHVVADRPGSYVDCTVRLPNSRYVSVGFYLLWGPCRGTFELDVLSRAQARFAPGFAQGEAVATGRMLGYVPGKAMIFTGGFLDRRRDPGAHHPAPILNPAPDQPGVLRIICQGKSQRSNSFLFKLDRLRVDTPPRTLPGWQECEGLRPPETSDDLRARVARYGRYTWSGWGALLLDAPPGGKAVLTALVPTGPSKPTAVHLTGTLGPDQGGWQARVVGGPDAVALKPGKDAKQTVEWVISAAGVTLPGPIALELTCTAYGKKARRMVRRPKAEIALDAWMVK